MKIASFNVNSIRARLEIVLAWLKKESPDVLCLQETKVVDEDFPLQPILDINYNVVFRGEKKYSGVALISKKPLEGTCFGFGSDGLYGTRLLSGTIDNVAIVNTYIPQGYDPSSDKFREKLDWFRRLYDFFDHNYSPDTPLIWVGDFNVAPEAIDVYDPEKLIGHVGYHPDEQAELKRVKDWGFVDVFRMHCTEPERYTFWDYRIRNAVKRNLGWRIDHIWATKPLAAKSVKAWVDISPRLKERPSDHAPIIADFRM